MDIKKARKLLGKAGKGLSDEKLMDEVHRMEALANIIIIDRFLELTPEEKAKFAKVNKRKNK